MMNDKLKSLYNEAFVNINGEMVSAQNATISIFDRGFLYGDSIYEVTYSQDSTVLFLEDHLNRLENSAKLIGMHLFLSREYLKSQILKTLRASKIVNAYIRLIITRGETELTLDPNASFKNNMIIIVKKKPEYPQWMYNKGLKLTIVSVLRNDPLATDPNAKSGNYLNNVMAIAEAKNHGFDDAIMINRDGNVTEGTTFNIWMVKNGVVYTPPTHSGLLEGITRQKLITLCQKFNVPLKIENITPSELLSAQEVFITSSTRTIMSVHQIDDKIYGEGINEWPVTQVLAQHYNQLLNEHKACKDYYYGP